MCSKLTRTYTRTHSHRCPRKQHRLLFFSGALVLPFAAAAAEAVEAAAEA